MQRIVVVLSSFLVAALAHAASFDCAKADSKVEHMICDNSEISQLDEQLSVGYKLVSREKPNPEAIRQAQHQWLKERNNCLDITCLKSAYLARITQLSAISSSAEIQDLNEKTTDKYICRTVAESAASEKLKDLLVKGDLFDSFKVDLDGDGIIDDFSITIDGSAGIHTGYAKLGKKDAVEKQIDDYDSGHEIISLLKVVGKYHVLSSSGAIPVGDIPGKLWHVGKDGEFHVDCEFSKGVPRLILGNNNPVCLAVKSGNISYVDYAFEHKLGDKINLAVEPQNGLAKVDVDNDGIKDNVVRVDVPKYSFTDIEVTDTTGSTIIRTEKLKEYFAEMNKYSDRTGFDRNIFVYGGIAYVNTQYKSGNRRIHRIKDGKAETICEFRSTFVY